MSSKLGLEELDELDELDGIDWDKADLQLFEPELFVPNCNTDQYKDQNITDPPTSSNTDVRLHAIEGFDAEKGRTWQYPIDFPLRDYQFSIARRCLFTNTLVCLPTGLGKTFIAAVVMLNFYRWYPGGKIVFMAPTKPLVNQQIQACCNITALPKYEVAELTGATSAQKRSILWKQNRVFFLTPQVMQNDLSSGICPANEIVCCVIDEAHKALGNYAYTQVVRELVVNSVKFRLLALSATPGDDLSAIQEVVNNLLISCIELRTEESIDVMPYTHHKKVEKYVLKLDGPLGEVNLKFLNVLGGIVKKLYSHKAVYTDDAKKLGRFQLIKAREHFRNSVSGAFIGPVEGEFAVGISLYHSYELLYSSGIRACYLSIKRLLSDGRSSSRLHSEVVKNSELNQIMSKMEKLVDSMHKFFLHTNSMDPNVSIVSFGDEVTIDLTSSLATDSFFYSHPKLLKLEEVVVTHFRTASTADNTSTRVMIFSSYRDSVEEISVMLHRHTPLVRVMCFYGHGSRPGGTQGQKGFTQKEQLKVMERFRGGGYNVLVSTCVGEEGLDIGDVDLIVCFDSPKAPTRYVQRMGRTGRKREGRIVMLLSEGKEEQAYQKCQSSKKHIYKIVTEGHKHLNFFSNSPRMVPTLLSPQPNKLFLQQEKPEEDESKPAVTRGVHKVKKKRHTKCTDKLPGFSTAMNELNDKDRLLSSEQEIAKSLVSYSLSQQESLQLKERLSTYTGPRQMLALKDEQGIEGNSCVDDSGRLDCSEWLYCQTGIQTDLVTHSTKSQIMIDLIKTFDHLKNSENAVEEYEAALRLDTSTQQSVQTGFDKLSLKTNINQRSSGAKNKKKHVKIDSSDSESLLECSTTPTHSNHTNSSVRPDSIEHPFASATVRQRIFTLESSSDEANSDDNKQHESRNSSPVPPLELSFEDSQDSPPDINTSYNNNLSSDYSIHSSPIIFDEKYVEIDFFDSKTPKATSSKVFDSPTHIPVSPTHLSSLNTPGISLLSKTSTPNQSSNLADIICIDTTDEKLRDCIKISPLLNPITSPSFVEDIPGHVSGKKKIHRKNIQLQSSDSENEAFESLCRKRKFQSKRRIISSQFSPGPVAAPNNPRKKRRLNCFIDDEAIESDGECSNNSILSPPNNDTSSSVYTEDNSAVSCLIADTSVNTTGCNESSVYARYVRDIISPPLAPASKLVIDPKRHIILATAGKNIIKFKEKKFDSIIADSSADYEAEEVYGVVDEEAERLLFQSPTDNKSTIFTPPHPVKSTNSVILVDSNVTDKQQSFSLGMDDWMEDPICVFTSVEESEQPSLENEKSSKITNSPLKQTFSLGMDDWWEGIDPGDLDTDFLTNNPPSQAQVKSEILPSTPSIQTQTQLTTTTTTCTSTPVLSSLSKEFSLPISVTHSPISSANNAVVVDSFSSSFKSPYYSTEANQSSLMTSSLNSTESSVVIFADTREVSGSQILSSLRIKHGICIHVYSLKHCSYLVSSRMAVDRHNVSDLSQQNSTQKIIDRARSMCELYDRCSVIVERDRVRSKLPCANKPSLARNQLFLTNLARLCKSRISVLFSGSEQNTIDLLVSLSKQEAKRGHKITGSLLQVDTPLFKFICCIPKISPTIALSLTTSLQNLNQLHIATPAELQKICVCISKEQTDSIHKLLAHRVVPNIVTHAEIKAASLSFYSDEEIKKLSVQKIYNPVIFDSLLYPLPGGAHDPALGPMDNNESCVTCGLRASFCPGHFGHIQLPLIVYNPVLFNLLYKLLKKSCFVCHRFLFKSPLDSMLLEGRLRLASAGYVPEAIQLEEIILSEEMKEADPDNIQQAIDIVIADKIGESGRAEERDTRHVKQYKNTLINELLRAAGAANACKHCEAPVRAVRQDFNSKFSLMPLPGRKIKRYLEAWSRFHPSQLDTSGEEEDLVSRKEIDIKWCTTNVLITPLEVREHIQQLWQLESSLIIALFNGYSTANTGKNFDHNIFFISVLPVPPSNCRPMANFNGSSYEGPQTANIKNILIRVAEMQKAMNDLREKGDKTAKDYEQFQYTWGQLQNSVNGFFDSDLNSIRTQKISPGIRQLLEHKQGLFRQHMMGKRVDYSARSVISPDFNIDVDEIGIPLVFATNLTFPEPVTPWNVKHLRQAIVNGPLIHPGATHVEDSDGTRVLLNAKNKSQREAIARQLLTPSTLGRVQSAKKVHRHLIDGDVLLVNRQPTLHRPSIMAHKARVLSDEKTLRLHYANCKAYNADFDGDEMNIHLPQDQIARSEAINLMSTPHQYLTPKDGSPLSGLIQDHVIGGVLLTIRGQMLDSHLYQQLIYSALPQFDGRLLLVPPCQIKPKRRWSGKQVITTILKNIIPKQELAISLYGKTKTGSMLWTQERYMSENEVIIQNGDLLCGVLDKSQFGSSQFGLVHGCHELYGPSVSSKLLSAFARLFTVFLQYEGFSMGVKDILLTEEGEEIRDSIIATSEKAGIAAARELFSAENDDVETLREKYKQLHLTGGPSGKVRADKVFKKHANLINNELNSKLNIMHLKSFPSNALHLMVEAGAKGSAVNRLQISALLGQIELEGARPPLTTSGRSLPILEPYDLSLEAGGFVTGRFLTGISPQEYYFHCMAGREGLIDTAVKTSRSGYLQRCLVKHLEGVKVNYDLTVRDSDGSVIQFLFGEDGINPEFTAYLNPGQFRFITDNMAAMNRRLLSESAVSRLHPGVAADYIDRTTAKVSKRARKLNCTNSEYLLCKLKRSNAFLNFYTQHSESFRIDSSQDIQMSELNNRKLWQLAAIDHWYHLTDEELERYYKYSHVYYDTVQSLYQPDIHIGSLSDKMQSLITNYLSTEFKSNSGDVTEEDFRSCIELKYRDSLCQPGDPVGLLAAQSIGEPSTQMTLNTFHFAGRGEMNVTLGIPRLREIIMSASGKISTPCVEIPLLPGLDMSVAREIERSLKKITVHEVLEKFEVYNSIVSDARNSRFRKVKLRLSLLSKKHLKSTFGVTPKQILSYVETKFIRIILTTLTRMVKNQHDSLFKVKVDKIIDENKEQALKEDGEEDGGGSKGGKIRGSILEDVESSDSGGEAETLDVGERKDDDDDDDGGVISESGSDGETEQKEQLKQNGEDATTMDTADSVDDSVLTSTQQSSTQHSTGLSERAKKVLGRFPQVKQYTYDEQKHRWCEITFSLPLSTCFIMIAPVLKNLVTRCVVREAEGIKRAFVKEEKGEISITTDGANIRELWKYHDKLDMHRLYSNDIMLIANTYGIEAATRSISRELSSVFKMYGISIDPRHLSLIADYQTVDGRFRGCNRIAMECNASPFQQMSFETPMKFLKDSSIGRMTDYMDSPSANIISGQLVKSGTGCFDLIQKLF